jgi:hypothetical protein
MKRALALLVPLVFVLASCCTTQQRRSCPHEPGSPEYPASIMAPTPQRPIVWDVHRGGKLIGLVYEPATPSPWTVVYADGALPFQSSDTMSEYSSAVPFNNGQLCDLLRSRVSLGFADLVMEDAPNDLDLNNFVNQTDCPGGE